MGLPMEKKTHSRLKSDVSNHPLGLNQMSNRTIQLQCDLYIGLYQLAVSLLSYEDHCLKIVFKDTEYRYRIKIQNYNVINQCQVSHQYPTSSRLLFEELSVHARIKLM